MKLELNKEKLLCVWNEIEWSKELNLEIWGMRFVWLDQEILVEHKKKIKIINLKNLGNNMNVLFLKDNILENINLDFASFEYGLCFFEWFDEETGKRYSFLPKFAIWNIEQLNNNLKKIDSKIRFENKNNFVISKETRTKNLDCIFSFLFAFVLIYWKLDLKNGDLKSIKLQIPLLWVFANRFEIFDEILWELNELGIFVTIDKMENADWMVYQISVTDFELLKIFGELYLGIQKIENISKLDYSERIKGEILDFVNREDIEIGEWLKIQIEKGFIKLLKY